MKLFINLFIFNIALVLTGCQTTSQNFILTGDESNQKGTIYIFNSCNKNSDTWVKGNVPTGPTLYVNGINLGVLGVNTYVPVQLTNGKHLIKVTKNWNYNFIPKLEYEITIEPNEAKFIEYRLTSITDSKYVYARSVFHETQDDNALKNIEDCELNTELLETTKNLKNQASRTL
jgi:hypothetical protein